MAKKKTSREDAQIKKHLESACKLMEQRRQREAAEHKLLARLERSLDTSSKTTAPATASARRKVAKARKKKTGKLTGSEKAAFLLRMAKGRAMARKKKKR